MKNSVTIKNALTKPFAQVISAVEPIIKNAMLTAVNAEKNRKFYVYSIVDNDNENAECVAVIEYNYNTDKFSLYRSKVDIYAIDNRVSSYNNRLYASRVIVSEVLLNASDNASNFEFAIF